MTQKHAYLIMAHGEFPLLQCLARALDDPRNDLFIHIDAKVSDLPEVRTEKAGVHMLKDRIDVRWGDVSQIETELLLFKTAGATGPYTYYHLLSGVDLPLKSQDYIHHFFETHAGKEFIGFAETALTPEIVRKVQRWHLFPRHFRDGNLFIRLLRSAFLRLQEVAGIRRNRDIAFCKGANWVSVTDAFVQYFLSQEKWVRKVFSHSFCADEIVLQTLCWNSPFRQSLYDTDDEWRGNLRLIGWKDGRLQDWQARDFDLLAASDALFARKFNVSDMGFVERVLSLSR